MPVFKSNGESPAKGEPTLNPSEYYQPYSHRAAPKRDHKFVGNSRCHPHTTQGVSNLNSCDGFVKRKIKVPVGSGSVANGGSKAEQVFFT